MVFSTISIAEFKQDTAKGAAISATRNTVEVLRHRKRAEQHTECIVNYMHNIIQAQTVEERKAVPRCPPQDISRLDISIARAEAELRQLNPTDPILQEEASPVDSDAQLER